MNRQNRRYFDFAINVNSSYHSEQIRMDMIWRRAILLIYEAANLNHVSRQLVRRNGSQHTERDICGLKSRLEERNVVQYWGCLSKFLVFLICSSLSRPFLRQHRERWREGSRAGARSAEAISDNWSEGWRDMVGMSNKKAKAKTKIFAITVGLTCKLDLALCL